MDKGDLLVAIGMGVVLVSCVSMIVCFIFDYLDGQVGGLIVAMFGMFIMGIGCIFETKKVVKR